MTEMKKSSSALYTRDDTVCIMWGEKTPFVIVEQRSTMGIKQSTIISR